MTMLGTARSRLSRAVGRSRIAPGDRPVVPADPRGSVDGPLDPSLVAIRSGLANHRRRLWVRRIVRRAWLAVAGVVAAEAVLLGIARVVAIELLPVLVVAVAVTGVGIWLAAAVHARPSIGETALAVDAEGRLGDRVSSALSLASALSDRSSRPRST